MSVDNLGRYLLAGLLAGLALTGAACGVAREAPGKPESKAENVVEIQVDSGRVGTSRLRPGITHTQFSADPYNDEAAVAESRRLLASKRLFQNQHIMGWGALSPEPSPGVYNWASLDSRINLIRETSGIPVITLCCAPDWMKGGTSGKTDWSKLNLAPTPEHYADFADLAAQVARRYPDVKHYQVWHGLKGFYDPALRRWNYEAYTSLYNLVYRALKAVDAGIAVGGPSVTMDSWSNPRGLTNASDLKGRWGVIDQRAIDAVEYWLKHKEGADFITLDMSIANKDEVALSTPFDSTHKLRAIARWVGERSDLPLWAARWNPFPLGAADWGPEQQASLLATGLVEMITSKVHVALLWEPQARGQTCIGCLWTDTRLPEGGQATLASASLASLYATLPPGTPLLRTRSSSTDVTAISSPTTTVLINELARSQVVEVNGTPTELDPYEVRVVVRPSASPAAASER